MKRLIFIAMLLSSSAVSALDRFLDINLTTDFTNLKERSHVDFNSQAVIPFPNRALLLSPRISIFFDGSMDVSVATGLRHQTSWGVLGHHIFWDSTGTKDAHFHQVGHSLDFLTDMFDYRINYYHPITKEQVYKKFLVSPHKWIESEVIYKHDLFHLGAGPKYDLFDGQFGFQAKATVPFSYFSVGAIGSYDQRNGLCGAVSLSFRLYGTPRKNSLESPIYHQSRVQYSKEQIFIPPPPPKKKHPAKHDKKADYEEVEKEDETPQEPLALIPDEIPAPPPPPPPRPWWQFFFRN